MQCANPTAFFAHSCEHTHTHSLTLKLNVSSGCCVDAVLCSECSDSEWRSQKAHAEVESSTRSLKWLPFMLHIVLELEEAVQKTAYFKCSGC